MRFHRKQPQHLRLVELISSYFRSWLLSIYGSEGQEKLQKDSDSSQASQQSSCVAVMLREAPSGYFSLRNHLTREGKNGPNPAHHRLPGVVPVDRIGTHKLLTSEQQMVQEPYRTTGRLEENPSNKNPQSLLQNLSELGSDHRGGAAAQALQEAKPVSFLSF